MSEKYDNQVYTQVKESFSYIEEIPVASAIIDLEENCIVSANQMFQEVFGLKNLPASSSLLSNYDFSSFVKEIEITKGNLILTNTEMVKLNTIDGNKINADIKIKLVNKVKANLAVMVINPRVVNELPKIEQVAQADSNINNFNVENLKNISEKLPILTYVYDIETTEIIYLNSYTKEFFKDSTNDEIVKKLGINTHIAKSNESILSYEKTIGEDWFKIGEITSLWEGNRVVKIGIGVDISESKKGKKVSAGSTIDTLTGIYNKIAGYNRLQECIDRIKEDNSIFSLCYLDINKLTYVNENFGLKEGDNYIKTVVSTVRKIIRRSDLFARVGGDEFIIVLCDCPVITAQRIMKSINTRLEEINFEERQLYEYSISYGVLEVNTQMDLKVPHLIERAETEMNRVRFNAQK